MKRSRTGICARAKLVHAQRGFSSGSMSVWSWFKRVIAPTDDMSEGSGIGAPTVTAPYASAFAEHSLKRSMDHLGGSSARSDVVMADENSSGNSSLSTESPEPASTGIASPSLSNPSPAHPTNCRSMLAATVGGCLPMDAQSPSRVVSDPSSVQGMSVTRTRAMTAAAHSADAQQRLSARQQQMQAAAEASARAQQQQQQQQQQQRQQRQQQQMQQQQQQQMQQEQQESLQQLQRRRRQQQQLQQAAAQQQKAMSTSPTLHPSAAVGAAGAAGACALAERRMALENERLAQARAMEPSAATLRKGTASPPQPPRRRYVTKEFVIGGMQFQVDERYAIKCIVGKGAYGLVCAAEDALAANSNSPTSVVDGEPRPGASGAAPEAAGGMLAVKKVIDPFQDRTDCKRLLREIRLLRSLRHPNILHLRDVMPPVSLSAEHWNDVYLVTRLFDTNLHRVIYSGQPLSDAHVQYIMWQAFRALRYMHAAGVVHRDMNPTNILLNRDCELALADLGLARHIGELENDMDASSRNGQLTKYVVTRWYRAPELLVQNSTYGPAVDMWSIGCILAEVLGSRALFPGKDSLHQLKLIVERLGTPAREELALIENEQAVRYVAGLRGRAARSADADSPKSLPGFEQLFPTASRELIDLLSQLLQFDPSKRPTADEALMHPYLAAYHDAPEEDLPQPEIEMSFESQNLSKEELRRLVYNEALIYRPWLAEASARK